MEASLFSRPPLAFILNAEGDGDTNIMESLTEYAVVIFVRFLTLRPLSLKFFFLCWRRASDFTDLSIQKRHYKFLTCSADQNLLYLRVGHPSPPKGNYLKG